LVDSVPAAAKIQVFAGMYGSGKTEVALNQAERLSAVGRAVTLVDLDVVTPYFCSRHERERLQSAGIRLISAGGQFAFSDLTSIPAEVIGALGAPADVTVVDVGGDEAGTTVLGSLREYVGSNEYALIMVVNTYRPFTRHARGILESVELVEKACRMSVAGLVSNPNMGAATTAEMVLRGHEAIREACDRSGLPLLCASVDSRLAVEVEARLGDCPVFPIRRHFVLPWETRAGGLRASRNGWQRSKQSCGDV
jgi:hypothetical protein